MRSPWRWSRRTTARGPEPERYRMKLTHRGLALLAALTVSHGALADAVGYAGVVDVKAESDAVVAEPHHDWSRATEPARWKMISTTKDPFTADNTFAFLRPVDKKSGRELFKKPVPALTFLWVSPDSRWVVGL